MKCISLERHFSKWSATKHHAFQRKPKKSNVIQNQDKPGVDNVMEVLQTNDCNDNYLQASPVSTTSTDTATPTRTRGRPRGKKGKIVKYQKVSQPFFVHL